jgi:hypothetical protein
MKRTILRLTVVLLTFGLISASGEDTARVKPPPEGKMTLEPPEVWVESFPMLVKLTAQHNPEVRGVVWVMPQNLASTYYGGIGIYFNLTNEEGEKLQVGYEWEGDPRQPDPVDMIGLPFSVPLKDGNEFTITFDMGQLTLDALERKGLDRLPGPGGWTISANADRIPSNAKKVIVRQPTEDEMKIAEKLAVKGRGKSWFPNVAQVDEPVPDASHLPIETSRIVELIRVLRAAVKSPEAGLKTIAGIEINWGHLKPLLLFVRYECLLQAGKPKEAQAFKEAYPEHTRELQFRQIDKGRGLIARLRAPLEAAKVQQAIEEEAEEMTRDLLSEDEDKRIEALEHITRLRGEVIKRIWAELIAQEDNYDTSYNGRTHVLLTALGDLRAKESVPSLRAMATFELNPDTAPSPYGYTLDVWYPAAGALAKIGGTSVRYAMLYRIKDARDEHTVHVCTWVLYRIFDKHIGEEVLKQFARSVKDTRPQENFETAIQFMRRRAPLDFPAMRRKKQRQ